jgi:hypothetical protein
METVMLEKLADLPRGVEGLRAVGKVTSEDYYRAFEPMLDEVRRGSRQFRFVYELGAEFDGFTPVTTWQDAKISIRLLRLFDGLAIVGDADWIREAGQFVGFMMPFPVRVFGNQDRHKAVEWLSALPESSAHSLGQVPDAGVLVVEVNRALRAQDFDTPPITPTAWTEAHGELRGIAIHAHEFPGWESVGSMMRHVRFVCDQHPIVNRVAFAADRELASFVPRLAEHFAGAEVKTFGYDALDGARTWARGARR